MDNQDIINIERIKAILKEHGIRVWFVDNFQTPNGFFSLYVPFTAENDWRLSAMRADGHPLLEIKGDAMALNFPEIGDDSLNFIARLKDQS